LVGDRTGLQGRGGDIDTFGQFLGAELLFSSASGINASGQVVGVAQTAGNGFDAFLYDGTAMLDLNCQNSLPVPAGD
jgi:probable HAF family extracellular repeat protein